MRTTKEEYLKAVDTVCMNCIFTEEVCEFCPVRKSVDRLNVIEEHKNIKEFWCKPLEQYVDSMLFDSGEQIANMVYEDEDWKINISLEVAGEVRVDYKGSTYRYPSDFPEELRTIIKNEGLFDSEDLYVDNNNWFEYIYDVIKSPSGKTYCDGLVCETDISKETDIGILNDMLGIVDWLQGE